MRRTFQCPNLVRSYVPSSTRRMRVYLPEGSTGSARGVGVGRSRVSMEWDFRVRRALSGLLCSLVELAMGNGNGKSERTVLYDLRAKRRSLEPP